MKRLMIIFIILIFLSLISASCEEGQIDINSASAEKLEEIIHVGPKVAGYIIEARSFNSLDDLVNVRYISLGYLEDIINQGLACIDGETEETNEKEVEEKEENIEEKQEPEVIYNGEIDKEENKTEDIKLEVIKLNAKTIKSEDDKEKLNKNNYAKYGFVFFCILLGFLFMLRKKKFNKNEFKE